MSNRLRTAEELGLRQNEYCALVKALDVLENKRWPERLFDMSSWWDGHRYFDGESYICNTACCIGGTADAIVGRKGLIAGAAARCLDLYDLCYPGSCSGGYDATQEQGAQALRNYLTTGKARWGRVMESKRWKGSRSST